MARTILSMLLWPQSATLETLLLVPIRNARTQQASRHPLSPLPWHHGYKGEEHQASAQEGKQMNYLWPIIKHWLLRFWIGCPPQSAKIKFILLHH